MDEMMSDNSEDSDSLLDEMFLQDICEDKELDDGKLSFINFFTFKWLIVKVLVTGQTLVSEMIESSSGCLGTSHGVIAGRHML